MLAVRLQVKGRMDGWQVLVFACVNLAPRSSDVVRRVTSSVRVCVGDVAVVRCSVDLPLVVIRCFGQREGLLAN